MKTIFLPAHSFKNKEFTENLAKEMGLSDYEIINWEHWKDNNPRPLDIVLETDKALIATGSLKVNIWAKSIGTYIAIKLYQKIPDRIDKIILCGFPLNDIDESMCQEYMSLADFPPDKIVVIQNENDPHGSYKQAVEVFNKVNPEIVVISKPRSDHEYPYPQDFREFLIQ